MLSNTASSMEQRNEKKMLARKNATKSPIWMLSELIDRLQFLHESFATGKWKKRWEGFDCEKKGTLNECPLGFRFDAPAGKMAIRR